MEDFNSEINHFILDHEKHVKAVNDAIDYLINDTDYLSTKEEKIELFNRGLHHDESKMKNIEEFKGYINMARELRPTKYGSEEYIEIRKKYEYVCQMHFKNNRHHPEHFLNGVYDMNHIDLLEMCCDWVGAMVRENSLEKAEESLKSNKERFKISDELWAKYKPILDNIIKYFRNLKK